MGQPGGKALIAAMGDLTVEQPTQPIGMGQGAVAMKISLAPFPKPKIPARYPTGLM